MLDHIASLIGVSAAGSCLAIDARTAAPCGPLIHGSVRKRAAGALEAKTTARPLGVACRSATVRPSPRRGSCGRGRRSTDPSVRAWVYLLWCRADDSLYTGWTNDLQARLGKHAAGTASRYTRTRLPIELALALPMADAGAARREEARIKQLTRAHKLALIAAGEPPA